MHAYERTKDFLTAVAALCVFAFVLTAPVFVGDASLLPENFIQDALTSPEKKIQGRSFDDPTPIVLELGRERLVAQGLQNGLLYKWNPYSGAGAPLWAEQGSPFFPAKWIYYAWPSHTTHHLALILRLIVAGLGMCFFLRALGLQKKWALTGGLFFEGSGALFAQIAFLNSSAIYMMPLLLWAAHRLIWHPGARTAGLGALCVGLTGLGGHPTLIMLAYIAFGVYWIGTLVIRKPSRREIASAIAWSAVAVVLGLMLTAIATLPFLELVKFGLSYKDHSIGDLAWQGRLFTTRTIFPLALLAPSVLAVIREQLPNGFWPTAQGASIGLVVLSLALANISNLKKQLIPLVLVLLSGIAFTLAPYGTQWLHQLPGLKIILPWYGYPLIVLPLCVFAAFGLERLASQKLNFRNYAIVCLFLGVGFLGATHLVLGSHWSDLPVSAFSSVFFLLIAAFLVFRSRQTSYVLPLLVVLAIVEIVVERVPTIFQPRSPILVEQKTDARYRFTGPIFGIEIPNTSLLYGTLDFRSCSPLPIKRFTEYLDLIGQWDHNTFQYPAALQIPLLSKASVKYIFDVDGFPSLGSLGLIESKKKGPVTHYENPKALPRVRVAQKIQIAQNEVDSGKLLKDLSNRPDWAETTIIEGGEPIISEGSGTVQLMPETNPDELIIQANLKNPSYVLISDTYYPGWKAYVDGQESKIYPADLMFRAVKMPAGQHQLQLKYEPESFLIGAWMSLVALLGIGLLFLI